MKLSIIKEADMCPECGCHLEVGQKAVEIDGICFLCGRCAAECGDAGRVLLLLEAEERASDPRQMQLGDVS